MSALEEPTSEPLSVSSAGRRVESIVAAAERAADHLRQEAERRSAARIAEAGRAADHRVAAAEVEAAELLDAARRQAETLVVVAAAEARRLRSEAHDEARGHLAEARALADEVLAEGTELGHNLHALGASLHANAELLLRDVAVAHRRLVSTLDRIEAEDDDGVPDFVARRPPRTG